MTRADDPIRTAVESGMNYAEADAAQIHRDALADTSDAYTAFKGWTLRCSWCDYLAFGTTKAEALRHIQDHYDRVLPEGAEIR